MDIRSASFVVSNTDITKCPAPTLPEYAFIGRSNVGKSSLINMLVGRKDLAKTSSRPGKTQLINHFLINENWYLVDLPGYGYAQVSREKREQWEQFIRAYILGRANLMCLMVLVDSRIPPQAIDLDFMGWLGEKEIPFAIVFTKIDKLSKKQFSDNIHAYREELLKSWEALPAMFYTSAEKRTGRDEVLAFISEANKAWK